MRDWCDDLLAGLRIPADATAGLDAYCASRGWKADVTSRAADGATCVTIWPAALDLSEGVYKGAERVGSPDGKTSIPDRSDR
jgi:hypothetical protein